LFASALSGNLAASFEQIGNTVPDALLNDDGLALLAASNTAGEGGAYLNYILFDENYIPVDYGFQRLDQSAQGTLAEHQQLTLVANVKKNGYLYTYVSNETSNDINAFFDDFKITYTNEVEVIRFTDYYPYGSVMRSEGEKYRFGYQGEFAEQDDETGWNAFELRMYDSKIGTVDGA